MAITSSRPTLRDLPLSSRLVVAAFLISAGFGYFSALVQLHFQGGTPPGEFLPGPKEAVGRYHGSTERPMSQFERLLESTEGSFNGSGTMRPAFFEKSRSWRNLTQKLSPEQVQALREEREGERLALLDWVRSGAPQGAYDKDEYAVEDPVAAAHPITSNYVLNDGAEKSAARRVKIQSLINDRCASCHVAEGSRDNNASPYQLDNYPKLTKYLTVEPRAGGMSLTKLAQTTHVHLLGFAMLYGLTGLIFTFTSYPGWVRAIFGPFTLIAQLVDISCWWLGRADPYYAQLIAVTGGLVAIGLFIQIVGSLFNLFGGFGKVVLVALMLAVGYGGYVVKERVIDPHLQSERSEARPASP